MSVSKNVLLGFVGAVILGSCGVQESAEPKASPEPVKESVIKTVDPKEVVVEYRKDGEQLALVVEQTKDMPVCERALAHKLVYIKESNTFFSCDGSAWQEIEIKGEKGEPGIKGDKGEKGDAAAPIPPNQWYDPITKKYWLIGGMGNYAMVTQYAPTCTGDFRLPTRSEGLLAGLHGLKTASNALGGPATFWTSEVDLASGQFALTISMVSTIMEESKAMTTSTVGVICIKN